MNITLKNFTEKEYDSFVIKSIDNYSNDMATNYDLSKEKALEMSRKQFESILKDGYQTQGHHFKMVLDVSSKALGHIWIGPRAGFEGSAFIYDLFINEDFRGQGLGSIILNKTEEFLKTEGFSKLSLHVFGHNKAAIRLYEKNDYQVTNLHMEKLL